MAYTDRTNSVTSIFTMESEAPPSPTSLLSEVVTTAEAKVYFDWQDVDDPSGVTYIFQVASGPAFTTTLLEKKGLTNSEYTITREVNFKEKTYYYWRLKAVDGASNESEWTAPQLLQVEGFQASKPERDINIWAIGIFAGIGVIVLLLTLAYFTGRK